MKELKNDSKDGAVGYGSFVPASQGLKNAVKISELLVGIMSRRRLVKQLSTGVFQSLSF